MKRNIFKLAVAPLLIATVFSTQLTPAHAADEAVAIVWLAGAGIISSVNFYDSKQGDKAVERQREITNYGETLRSELGSRYEMVITAMARNASPQSLSWMQAMGPASKASYDVYQHNYRSQ